MNEMSMPNTGLCNTVLIIFLLNQSFDFSFNFWQAFLAGLFGRPFWQAFF